MTIICSLEHICATDRFDQIGQIWQLVLDFGCINDTESLLSLCWALICLALLSLNLHSFAEHFAEPFAESFAEPFADFYINVFWCQTLFLCLLPFKKVGVSMTIKMRTIKKFLSPFLIFGKSMTFVYSPPPLPLLVVCMTIITRPSVTAKRLRALTWPDKYWSQYWS